MHGMMKFALACSLVALLASHAMAQSIDELYAAAKAEGVVEFAGAMKQKETQEILKAFEKRYPGIRVTYTRRSTEPMVQLIEANRLANRNAFDLINVTEPGDLVRWKKEGFIAKVEVPELDQLLPDTYDPDHTFYAIGITPMVAIYNTGKLKPADAPKSLHELLEPKWKGTIVITRPSRGGTGGAALMNVVAALGHEVIARARDLDLLLTRGNEAAIDSVVSGERLLSWGVSGYRAIEAKNEGAPIDMIWWTEGTATVSFSGAVTAKAAHPNAARLLLRWLLSKEGQELVVGKLDFHSSRRDVAAVPKGQLPLSQLPIRMFPPEQVVAEGQALAAEFDRAMGLK
jgi:iron(III) transport system substrate-binding protein